MQEYHLNLSDSKNDAKVNFTTFSLHFAGSHFLIQCVCLSLRTHFRTTLCNLNFVNVLAIFFEIIKMCILRSSQFTKQMV